jgi:hypothetical protein
MTTMKRLLLLVPIVAVYSCNERKKEQALPADSASPAKPSNYFSFQGGNEYSISNPDKTIILDFVASGGTPNIRYNIDNGPWYKVSDDNCTAFRVHVVVEKGKVCRMANDTGLYVSGHFEREIK